MSRSKPRKPEAPPEDVLTYTRQFNTGTPPPVEEPNVSDPKVIDAVPHLKDFKAAEPATATLPSVDKEGNALHWIQITDAAEMMAMDIPRPAPLINGLLCAGEKMLTTAASKSLKTYTSFDAAISVATGSEFWGMETTPGKVLFANLEIPPYSVQDRLHQVCSKKGIERIPPGTLSILNMRGSRFEIGKLTQQLQYSVEQLGGEIGMIIIDPVYKAMPSGMSENADETIREFTNYLDQVAEETGAAVFITHHHPKGSMAERAMIDRGSGSGVWARDADVIVDMIRHEEDDHYVISNVQRSRASLDDFVVRVDFPLFVRADDMDPDKLKKSGGGSKPRYNAQMLLDAFDDPGQGLKHGEWLGRVSATEGMKKDAFNKLRKQLLDDGEVDYSETSKLYRQIVKKS